MLTVLTWPRANTSICCAVQCPSPRMADANGNTGLPLVARFRTKYGDRTISPAIEPASANGSHFRIGVVVSARTPSGAATSPIDVSFAPQAAAAKMPSNAPRRQVSGGGDGGGDGDGSTITSKPAASINVA